MTPEQLGAVWQELRQKAIAAASNTSRIYRALGKNALGIRASYRPEDDREELLVEIPSGWLFSRPLPEWQGIEVLILPLHIGSGSTHQLALTLMDSASEDVFLHFASDMTTELEGITDPKTRAQTLILCLDKWNRFFLKAGPAGLSIRAQMGLFGELCLLESILDKGKPVLEALTCWKGPDRGYHDFDIDGTIIEVKTTASKEPRKIWINNERQLDWRGSKELFLVVFTIAQTQGGGKTLPKKVDEIQDMIAGTPGAEAAYQRKLISSGYLQRHARRYLRNFSVLKTEMFLVTDDTPRIIELPTGIGDIRYSVLVASCESSLTEYNTSITAIIGGSDIDE